MTSRLVAIIHRSFGRNHLESFIFFLQLTAHFFLTDHLSLLFTVDDLRSSRFEVEINDHDLDYISGNEQHRH